MYAPPLEEAGAEHAPSLYGPMPALAAELEGEAQGADMTQGGKRKGSGEPSGGRGKQRKITQHSLSGRKVAAKQRRMEAPNFFPFRDRTDKSFYKDAVYVLHKLTSPYTPRLRAEGRTAEQWMQAFKEANPLAGEEAFTKLERIFDYYLSKYFKRLKSPRGSAPLYALRISSGSANQRMALRLFRDLTWSNGMLQLLLHVCFIYYTEACLSQGVTPAAREHFVCRPAPEQVYIAREEHFLKKLVRAVLKDKLINEADLQVEDPGPGPDRQHCELCVMQRTMRAEERGGGRVVYQVCVKEALKEVDTFAADHPVVQAVLHKVPSLNGANMARALAIYEELMAEKHSRDHEIKQEQLRVGLFDSVLSHIPAFAQISDKAIREAPTSPPRKRRAGGAASAAAGAGADGDGDDADGGDGDDADGDDGNDDGGGGDDDETVPPPFHARHEDRGLVAGEGWDGGLPPPTPTPQPPLLC